MYGRKITPEPAQGHAAAPVPAGAAPRRVQPRRRSRPSKEVILCEALIDALTFWCAGFRNVTASYGVEGFTDEHLEAFKRHGTERVLIAYDRDEAGDAGGAGAGREADGARGSTASGSSSPRGWTPTSTRCKVTPAGKEPGRADPQARSWLGKGRRPTCEPSGPEAVRGRGADRAA